MANFKRGKQIAFLVQFFVSVAAISGCSSLEKFDRRNFAIEGRNGRVTITAEIAVTDAQHAQGLMHRTALNDGEGMIFVFERDNIVSFWMKDTLIPLSIAFIAHDGRILEIRDMQPGDLTGVRSSRSVRYALEVPQGWFDRAGLATGDILDTAGL